MAAWQLFSVEAHAHAAIASANSGTPTAKSCAEKGRNATEACVTPAAEFACM